MKYFLVPEAKLLALQKRMADSSKHVISSFVFFLQNILAFRLRIRNPDPDFWTQLKYGSAALLLSVDFAAAICLLVRCSFFALRSHLILSSNTLIFWPFFSLTVGRACHIHWPTVFCILIYNFVELWGKCDGLIKLFFCRTVDGDVKRNCLCFAD